MLEDAGCNAQVAQIPPDWKRDTFAALSGSDLLTDSPNPALNNLVQAAAAICKTPIAIINFVVGQRQYYKARLGVERFEHGLDIGFCPLVVSTGQLLSVRDALQDPRFSANDAVTQEPFARSYCGVPLITSQSVIIGTIGVVDRVPRKLSTAQRELLEMLGRQVVALTELHISNHRLALSEKESARRTDASHRETELLKEVDRKLQASERMYRTIGDAVPDFIWACTAEGEAIFVNQRWCDYTGLTLETAGSVPSNVFHHPDDYPTLVTTWKSALASRCPYSVEVRIRRRDGVYRWFLARAVPVLDDDGQISQWIGTTTDIHERKVAEEALRESEAHYRQLTNAMPQLAWITAADGTPQFFNQRWYDYTGTTPQQMLSADRPTLAHPEERPSATKEWNRALATGEPYATEYRLRGANGSYRWFLARAVPLKGADGTVTRWLGTCTDIDLNKSADAKQRFLADSSATLASSLDYETTLATVAQLAVPTLADWCVVHVTEANSTVRQLAVAHVDPDKIKWAEALQSRYPYNPDAPRGVPNVLRTGRTEFYPDISDDMLAASAQDPEHLRIMREVGFTSVMIVPMCARGQTLGAITFVSAESGRPYDAADLATAEDLAHSAALAVDNARSFSAAQQEIALRQHTERTLLSHKEEIEALNARLRQSVEVTHHHVRNNLQIILALTQLPIEEGNGHVPVSALDRIEHHTSALAAIHDLLMERARIDAPVDCLSVLSALEKLMPLLQQLARGRPIQYEADELMLPVQKIGSLCILVNELITNAIKHGAGLITLKIAAEHGAFRLRVCDEGPGFPEAFDWRTTTGTGLCLIDIAGRHDLGGRVDYSNRADGGARVTVDFPLIPPS